MVESRGACQQLIHEWKKVTGSDALGGVRRHVPEILWPEPTCLSGFIRWIGECLFLIFLDRSSPNTMQVPLRQQKAFSTSILTLHANCVLL